MIQNASLTSVVAMIIAADDDGAADTDDDGRVQLLHEDILSRIAFLRSAYMPSDLRKHLDKAEAAAAVLGAKIKFELGMKARLMHRSRCAPG